MNDTTFSLKKGASEDFLHEHQMDHGVIRRNEERFIDSCVSFENDFRVSGTSLGLEVGVWWAEEATEFVAHFLLLCPCLYSGWCLQSWPILLIFKLLVEIWVLKRFLCWHCQVLGWKRSLWRWWLRIRGYCRRCNAFSLLTVELKFRGGEPEISS